jgi:hypothetical protein
MMVYHVFVSHNQQDFAKIKPIVRYLRESRLTVFFDEGNIAPADTLRSGLRKEIDESCTFLLVVGATGLGSTQQLEAEYADGRDRERKCHFVTLLLPDVDFRTVPAPYNRKPALYWLPPLHPGPARRFLCAILNIQPGPNCEEELSGLQPGRIQTGPGFPTELDYNGSKRTVTLYPLLRDQGKPNLKLSWETWGWAISKLEHQILGHKFNLEFDAYFGINEGGLAIAMALNLHRRPSGFLCHKGHYTGRRIVLDQCLYPLIEGQGSGMPRILLVDTELKTGKALELMVPALRAHYAHTELQIYYAVLVARTLKPSAGPIVRLDELEAWPRLVHLAFEDVFFCCLMGEQRMEPPYPK